MRAPVLLVLLAACSGTKPPATTQPANAADVSTDASCPDALPGVVATVAGEPITAEQLQEEAAGPLLEARMAMYQARKEAMESVIIDRMVQKELSTRGITEQQLLEQEIDAKVSEPSDAVIQAFYEKNQAQMNGASLEDVRPQIMGHLMQQQASELTHAFIQSLEAKYEVSRNLRPLRVDVNVGNSARKGPESAPVTIVEFSDFQCPYCTMAAETVNTVMDKYGDKVSLVYRHFPLPMHRQAGKAAEGAECAREQKEEAFWGFHDALFADQKPWTQQDLVGYATQLELDVPTFTECLESGRMAAKVMMDVEDGQRVGMSGTPGFYINGVMLSGAQPPEAFYEVIDAELAKDR